MSFGCGESVSRTMMQASSSDFGSTERAPRSRRARTRRSPTTFSVISCTVAKTPPIALRTDSSGTGLYAIVKCVSSKKPQ